MREGVCGACVCVWCVYGVCVHLFASTTILPTLILSGYFTSRPALKGYVRELNSLLQVCKQLEVMGTKQSVRTNTASTKILRE